MHSGDTLSPPHNGGVAGMVASLLVLGISLSVLKTHPKRRNTWRS